jgi:hypothetical protein
VRLNRIDRQYRLIVFVTRRGTAHPDGIITTAWRSNRR